MTNAAGEIFQYIRITNTALRTNGVKSIADDIFVYGKTREEHDLNLEKCLTRLSNNGLRLNCVNEETLEQLIWSDLFERRPQTRPKCHDALKNAGKFEAF